MTDSKMPERIWVVDASGTGCIVSFDTPSLDYKHEYIRADLAHPAPVADAELEALLQRAEAIDPVLEVEFDTQMDVERNPYGAREAIEDALYLIRDLAAALRARTAQPVGVITVQDAAKVLLDTMTTNRDVFTRMVEAAEDIYETGVSFNVVVGDALRAALLPDGGAPCRKCGGEMKPGIAMGQTLTGGTPDFPGDEVAITLSAGGPGQVIGAMKCSACGWSVTDGGA